MTSSVELETSLNEQLPFTLAYTGDAYYELWCRQKVLFQENGNPQNPKTIHRQVVQLVRCQTQSKLMQLLLQHLSSEEFLVFKRGKNSKVLSAPKHASIKEYRVSTGFECLVGYWYLSNNLKRYEKLMELDVVKAFMDSLIQLKLSSEVA